MKVTYEQILRDLQAARDGLLTQPPAWAGRHVGVVDIDDDGNDVYAEGYRKEEDE